MSSSICRAALYRDLVGHWEADAATPASVIPARPGRAGPS